MGGTEISLGFLFSLNSYATEKHKVRKPKRVLGFVPAAWLEFLQHQNNKLLTQNNTSSAVLLSPELPVLAVESSCCCPGSNPVFVNFLT